ncbi:hypothetical protein AOB54_09960 [beta proteobacterium MWH-UniP1]
MRFKKSNYKNLWLHRHEFHVLTYAEEGFAPLNEHTKDTGITKKELVAFAETVNRVNHPGSLYPKAKVSAVPRVLIREQQDAQALCLGLVDFYQINATVIRAKKILLDFRTPNVETFVESAIEKSLQASYAAFIEELILVDDNAE